MLRNVLMLLVAAAVLHVEAFAGSGSSTGYLVVRNRATSAIAVVVDPPESWARFSNPVTDAQLAQVAKRATVIPAAPGFTAFKLKAGNHSVLAANLTSKRWVLLPAVIAKNNLTYLVVDPPGAPVPTAVTAP